MSDRRHAGIWLFSGGLSKRDAPQTADTPAFGCSPEASRNEMRPSEYLEFYLSYAYTALSKSAAMPTIYAFRF